VVVPAAGATVDPAGLIVFCGQHLAGYKKPKAVDVVASLPRTPYAKIAKREVRAPYWAGLDRVI
jgi:long-chain acyl-CoA synthetase